MSWMSKVLTILSAAIVLNVLVDLLREGAEKPLDLTTKIINVAWVSLLLAAFIWGTTSSITKA